MTRYHANNPTALGLSVSAIVWRGPEFLLMRRADNGFWGLPGGFVEVGESVAAAARREVEEETGWVVELGRLIGVYSDPATQVVDYSPGSSNASSSNASSADASSSSASSSAPAASGEKAPGESPAVGRGRVQIVNLCFHAEALSRGEPTTPAETLELGFFAAGALPEPFVPIHTVRVEDGLAGRAEAIVR